MKKLSVEKDDGKPILFLDAFTVIPGVGPDSDMDGHDLSGLSYSEEIKRDNFIEAFNDNYANLANEIIFRGMRVIVVKAFYDNDIFDDEDTTQPVNQQDAKAMLAATLKFWDEVFHLTDAEKANYLIEFKKKLLLP